MPADTTQRVKIWLVLSHLGCVFHLEDAGQGQLLTHDTRDFLPMAQVFLQFSHDLRQETRLFFGPPLTTAPAPRFAAGPFAGSLRLVRAAAAATAAFCFRRRAVR
jgi:hypothetical protein